MEEFDVVFAGDENYIQHVGVAITSLLENNKNILIKVNYLSDKISEKNRKNLIDIVASYERRIDFYLVNTDALEFGKINFHFSKAVYYRLQLAEILPLHKVLYLDADIVVMGNIENIFNIEISNQILAAVLNPGFARHANLGMDADAKYFNAGIFLANLDLWRSLDIYQKCLSYMQSNLQNIELADQDVLNAVVNGKWTAMPPRYNQQTIFFEPDFLKKYTGISPPELDLTLHSPVIVHFTGSSKPWQFMCRHPFKAQYWKFLLKTPFFPYVPDDLTLINFFRWLVPISLINIVRHFVR